jgi:hypothetical protein
LGSKLIPPLFSSEFMERFTREHPVQAWLVVLCGLVLFGFMIWLIASS